MDNLHNRLKFEIGRKSEIFYYSWKEDLKISRICTVWSQNVVKNGKIALRSFQIFYIFVLGVE